MSDLSEYGVNSPVYGIEAIAEALGVTPHTLLYHPQWTASGSLDFVIGVGPAHGRFKDPEQWFTDASSTAAFRHLRASERSEKRRQAAKARWSNYTIVN